jgi:hypothetical protein
MLMSYTIDYLISCCNTICHFVWADLLPAATSRGLSAGPGESQARRRLALCRVEQMGSPCVVSPPNLIAVRLAKRPLGARHRTGPSTHGAARCPSAPLTREATA